MKRNTVHDRPLVFAVLGLCGLALTGCGSNGVGGGNFGSVLSNTARSFLSARAFDRATVAEQQNNVHGTDVAFRDYMNLQHDEAGLKRLSESYANQGFDYDTQAAKEREGSPAHADLLRLSAESYRRALTLSSGKFESDNPNLLNALGYFLADRGDSPSDFKEAERLTRLSLATYDKLAQQSSAPIDANELAVTRANVRDSLTWAIYRQGRYAEAQREQEAVLQAWHTGTTALKITDNETEAELTYHLAAIYATQNKPAQARTTFQKALKLRPDFPVAQEGLKALTP